MKINKKTLLFISILMLTFAVIYFLLTKNQFLYGSNLDYKDQHMLFPEYFRLLFYETKDILPDFMPNLGGGQNIYYSSYYGLLNPVILFSYLFPALSMVKYLNITMILTVISSVILLYFYLRKNKKSEETSFIISFMFMCAVPLIFHSHRHIMFINYMPFLIMGLYGIDRFIEKKKSLLLITSLVLMIFTSYFFSVSGLIALFIFGVYRYLKKEGNTSIKKLIQFKLKLTLPFIISVLIAGVLLLPTASALLTGRLESNVIITFKDLFMPKLFMLYDNYNMGLTAASLLGVILILIKGSKADKLLSIILLLFTAIPIFNYVLNGFMYIDAKSLIPFIPLVMVLISELENKFEIKKKSIKIIIVSYIIISSLSLTVSHNLKDNLIEKEYIDNTNNYSNVVDKIVSSDSDVYRINNLTMGMSSVNMVTNLNEYKTSIYSSTFNTDFKDYYYNELNNNMVYRNKFVTNSSSNIFSQILFGEKYIISTEKLGAVYKEEFTQDNYIVYKNENVLPLAYATTNYINYKEYESLSQFDKLINIPGSIISNSQTTKELMYSENIKLDIKSLSQENIDIEPLVNGYKVTSKEDGLLELELENILEKDIMMLDFTLIAETCDLSIVINGIENKLTDKDWKYYNENEKFTYILTGVEKLEVKFTEGIYNISDITVSKINEEVLNKVNENIVPFNFNEDKTKGDYILGNITLKEEAYFTLSIPYDDGFEIKVNEEEVEYEKVNNAFIGLKLDKGFNEIIIEYKAPYKSEGLVISVVGVIALIGYIVVEKRLRDEKEVKRNSKLL